MLQSQNNSKPDFDIAEHLARELRLMQPQNDLALDVMIMEFDREIYFETFENYAMLTGKPLEKLTNYGIIKNGYTVKCGNIYIVFYHETPFISRRLNWTLAHEVGHIYLNHQNDGSIEEVEAHWFAAELLMPTPIITEILRRGRELTDFSLMKLFDVSFEAASKKVSSYNRMPFKSMYLYDDFMEKYNDEIELIIQQRKPGVMSV